MTSRKYASSIKDQDSRKSRLSDPYFYKKVIEVKEIDLYQLNNKKQDEEPVETIKHKIDDYMKKSKLFKKAITRNDARRKYTEMSIDDLSNSHLEGKLLKSKMNKVSWNRENSESYDRSSLLNDSTNSLPNNIHVNRPANLNQNELFIELEYKLTKNRKLSLKKLNNNSILNNDGKKSGKMHQIELHLKKFKVI